MFVNCHAWMTIEELADDEGRSFTLNSISNTNLTNSKNLISFSVRLGTLEPETFYIHK